MRYLKVTPGSVSPFGLIHDADHHVRVFLDRELKTAQRISFPSQHQHTHAGARLADFGSASLAATWNVVKFIDVARTPDPAAGPDAPGRDRQPVLAPGVRIPGRIDTNLQVGSYGADRTVYYRPTWCAPLRPEAEELI